MNESLTLALWMSPTQMNESLALALSINGMNEPHTQMNEPHTNEWEPDISFISGITFQGFAWLTKTCSFLRRD